MTAAGVAVSLAGDVPFAGPLEPPPYCGTAGLCPVVLGTRLPLAKVDLVLTGGGGPDGRLNAVSAPSKAAFRAVGFDWLWDVEDRGGGL